MSIRFKNLYAMSKKNKKRSSLKNETNGRAYHITVIKVEPYWDDGICFHKSRGKRTLKKLKKEITSWQYRMYRTWKYNRKTKYK